MGDCFPLVQTHKYFAGCSSEQGCLLSRASFPHEIKNLEAESLQGTSHVKETLSFLPNKGGRKSFVVNAANGGSGNLCSYPGSTTGFLSDLGQVPSLSLCLLLPLCKMGIK